jgi:hypothetical protein
LDSRDAIVFVVLGFCVDTRCCLIPLRVVIIDLDLTPFENGIVGIKAKIVLYEKGEEVVESRKITVELSYLFDGVLGLPSLC